MAPPNHQKGLTNYVQTKNGLAVNGAEDFAATEKESIEDLKVHLSGAHIPNHNASTKTTGQTSKAPARVKVEPGTQRTQSSIRRQSEGQGHFYDTDADSIDGTSTAASLNGDAINQVQYEDDSSEAGDDQNPDGEESTSEEANRERLRRMDRQLRTGANGRANGIATTYMKGDSYPSTTSGNPSISDVGNGPHPTRANRQYDVNHNHMHQVPHRGQRPPALNANLQRQPAHSAAPQNQPRTESGFFARQDSADSSNIHQQVNSGFAFSKAPQPHGGTNQPLRSQQQSAAMSTSARNPSSNTAQPPSQAMANDRSYHMSSEQRQPATAKAANAGISTKLPATKNRRPLQPLENEPRSAKPSPVAEPLLDETPKMNAAEDHEHGNQYREPESDLDHDVDQLCAMDYVALRGESFDVGPNATNVAMGPGGQNNSIAARLETAKRSDMNAQTHLFKSLSIQEWEQAGDWFLDQFSAAVGRLKEVRQQRRKAAHEHEGQIEGRFKAVGQKRKQIDMAMSEMKESGGKVLQGTPKKPKTK